MACGQPTFQKCRASLYGAAFLSLLALAALPGCAGGVADRAEHAEKLAGPAGLAAQTMPAGPFAMTAFLRVTQPGHPARVYIEGDGLAFIDRGTPSGDPTPRNPVGLELAAADPGPNVIYLARPCQYSRMADGSACPQKYWTDARLAPEVIDALNAELTAYKARYRLGGFELTGFSGGAGAAVLLAARRRDVTGLRTVAGNLDQALFTRLHSLSPVEGSLDPRDAARADAGIPQIHFVGGDDPIVPRAIAESFKAAAGAPACTAIRTVDHVSHGEGWMAQWPALLAEPLPCGNR